MLVISLYAARINFYLCFVFLTSFGIFWAYFLSNDPAAIKYSHYYASLGYLFTIYIVFLWFSRKIKIYKVRFIRALESTSMEARRQQIIFTFLLLLPFYAFTLPDVIFNAWWLDVEDRVEYMTESSVLLRGIKLTPLLFFLVLFNGMEWKNYKSLAALFLLAVVFVLFSGSKSNIIFLLAALTMVVSVNPILTFRDVGGALFLASSLFIASIIFFFAALSEGSLFTALGQRFASDIGGLHAAFAMQTSDACVSYNTFAPLISFAMKVFGYGAYEGHLSMGGCLAAPYDPTYPFELLIPLFVEGFVVGGIFGSILYVAAGLVAFEGMFAVTKLIANATRVYFLGFSIELFLLIGSLSVFFGGKLSNFVVSTFATTSFFLVVVGFTCYLMPKKRVHVLPIKRFDAQFFSS